jgi:transposase
MEQGRVERLDHLGLSAAVMKDWGLMAMIDRRLVPDAQEVMTPGEAIAGMILNGLGFATRPFSLTPQLFANTPLDLLGRDGMDAERCNRFTLGRTLEDAQAYGCNLLCEELALAVCTHEGSELRFTPLDTTSLGLTGAYIPDSDAHAMCMSHGYSQDHRPDLTQAVLALMVAHEGGVPLVSKSWDGNTAATRVVQERAAALLRACKATPSPRYRGADAKLSGEDHAAQLAQRSFITRIPATLQGVSQVMRQALQWDTWQPVDPTTRYQPLILGHYGMVQRWLVV